MISSLAAKLSDHASRMLESDRCCFACLQLLASVGFVDDLSRS